MTFRPTKTPSAITAAIEKICGQISPNVKPYYVNIQPIEGAREENRALIARDEANRVGGKVVFGWAVYVWKSALVDFIGHAIVSTVDNQYCVAPTDYDENRILFLPDDGIDFEHESADSRPPSKTISISKHKEVQLLIDIDRELWEIKAKYPGVSEIIDFKGEDAIRAKTLEALKEILFQKIIYLHHSPKAKCVCGSGRPFRKCCRPKMQKAFGTSQTHSRHFARR